MPCDVLGKNEMLQCLSLYIFLREIYPHKLVVFLLLYHYNSKEKICILAEELGHHETFAGNILDPSVSANRKQEYKARIWAYRKIISPDDLLSAFKSGCRNRYEIAEHIGVTEEFLEEALACFKTKYPEGLIKASYMIRFTPSLQIFMRFE